MNNAPDANPSGETSRHRSPYSPRPVRSIASLKKDDPVISHPRQTADLLGLDAQPIALGSGTSSRSESAGRGSLQPEEGQDSLPLDSGDFCMTSYNTINAYSEDPNTHINPSNLLERRENQLPPANMNDRTRSHFSGPLGHSYSDETIQEPAEPYGDDQAQTPDVVMMDQVLENTPDARTSISDQTPSQESQHISPSGVANAPGPKREQGRLNEKRSRKKKKDAVGFLLGSFVHLPKPYMEGVKERAKHLLLVMDQEDMSPGKKQKISGSLHQADAIACAAVISRDFAKLHARFPGLVEEALNSEVGFEGKQELEYQQAVSAEFMDIFQPSMRSGKL